MAPFQLFSEPNSRKATITIATITIATVTIATLRNSIALDCLTISCHFRDGSGLFVGHVAQVSENDKS